ncbi:predicted protein [Thalassiosira pseudonana CCMP1335]|jgi:hypothetical protein|uniref:peptidylprolyl isomerase n=1 Tax=Thalassiosira pseudonana TaxID=35128 RepID=B8BQ49_THAPS|nr:predicted protein [Thalassiosira pseudonana CCMP1335]EED95724.1 predicted protein [Thalassiosira pseudonana CCMP1335]
MNLSLCILSLLSIADGLSVGGGRKGINVPSTQHQRRSFLQQGGVAILTFSGVTSATTVFPGITNAAPPKEFVEVGQQETPPEGERPFQTLPNGVQVKEFRVGSGGAAVQSGSKVELTLKGRLLNLNGVIFYDTKSKDISGFGEGTPLQFTVGDGTVLPGLEAGIVGMTKNGIRRIIVPSELGYGTNPTLEPQPFTEMERRALESVVKNPRRDGTVLFDVKVERVR